MQYKISIIIFLYLPNSKRQRNSLLTHFSFQRDKGFQFELFHEQLPLPVPCYDLVPVTELAVDHHGWALGTPGSLDLTGGEYKT